MTQTQDAASRRPAAAERRKAGQPARSGHRGHQANRADRAQELVQTLTEEALKGTVTFDKERRRAPSTGRSPRSTASSPSSSPPIMHDPKFQQARRHLARPELPGDEQRDRHQPEAPGAERSKRELFKDLDRAVEFDQSQLFKKLYENEFGTPGGEPYGALIGDYEFTNHPEDIDMLRKMSNVAAAAFCPFISAAGAGCSASRASPSCPSRATWRRSSTRSNTPSGELPRLRGFALRHAGDAARPVAAALRREDQAGRGVRLRGSAV